MLSYSTPFSGYSFSYDERNRQTEAFVGAIGTSWLINGLGQRVAQINVSVPEFFFVYEEAGHQTGKYDGGGNLLQETVWLGDLPVAVLSPSGRFYIAPDHLGSPHQITDASGAVVWLWNHDPFGNGDPQGAFTHDLRFPGQFFDQGTKLHYNYFRDYDPRTGRHIESDPIGLAGGITTYTYVGGNPLSHTDADGLVTGGFSPIPNTSANVCKVGDVIHVCVLNLDFGGGEFPNECRHWCEAGGYLLNVQRNLGLPCEGFIREP